MSKDKNLISRYSYQTRYVKDVQMFMETVLNKTVVPHQLEVQPGRLGGEKLCWLSCPYCYGNTAKNTGERLTPERYVEILKQTAKGPHGAINKLIFAGYATDPLNYEHIDDLLQVARDQNQIFGFHTKAIKVSDRFVDLVAAKDIAKLSYFSISVDSGNPESYNRVHGVPESKADIYHKVIENIKRICDKRAANGCSLDVSATYLINQFNDTEEEVVQAIKDLKGAGLDIIRFTFPQVPRGHESAGEHVFVPERDRVLKTFERLKPLIEEHDSEATRVVIMDLDASYEIDELRTFPCFARFIFPSLGYDGFLSHCSESAAPHFRDMALGNLQERDFWDVFYDYDAENFQEYMASYYQKMTKNDCRCDRKEHVVNSLFRDAKVMNEL